MKWLSDSTLAHLCKVADWPDLTGSRYELVEKIGQGGMGAVFLVRDRELERDVALKVLNAPCADRQAAERLVTEARILARLEHPSIVPVHDCGILPDGRFFYAMKMVRGKRLDKEAGPAMALTERLQLFQKICDAVAFAHANGVIHRDLKPANIMVGAFGEVLILDWGVAKIVGRSHPSAASPKEGEGEKKTQAPLSRLGRGVGGEGTGVGGEPTRGQTQAGTVLGTPGYMAPEQARGESGCIDERADVYALGATLYFLLIGKAPMYDRPGSASTLLPPRRHDRSIPRPLEAVCVKALAVERDERYAGAAEMAADIANFLTGRRVAAYPEGLLEAAVRLGTKYRTVLVLLLAYLIMRIVFLIIGSER